MKMHFLGQILLAHVMYDAVSCLVVCQKFLFFFLIVNPVRNKLQSSRLHSRKEFASDILIDNEQSDIPPHIPSSFRRKLKIVRMV